MRKLLHQTGASAILVSTRTAGHVEDTVQEDTTADHLRAVTYEAAPFTRFVHPSSDPMEFSNLRQCQLCVREDDSNVIILHSSGTTGIASPFRLRRARS